MSAHRARTSVEQHGDSHGRMLAPFPFPPPKATAPAELKFFSSPMSLSRNISAARSIGTGFATLQRTIRCNIHGRSAKDTGSDAHDEFLTSTLVAREEVAGSSSAAQLHTRSALPGLGPYHYTTFFIFLELSSFYLRWAGGCVPRTPRIKPRHCPKAECKGGAMQNSTCKAWFKIFSNSIINKQNMVPVHVWGGSSLYKRYSKKLQKVTNIG